MPKVVPISMTQKACSFFGFATCAWNVRLSTRRRFSAVSNASSILTSPPSYAASPLANLLGEYDFSAEKLRDSVGIRLPKLGG